MTRIIFVTGTDTGVGKTLLTALLLRRLRDEGIDALAMKPFCSGATADVQLLQAIQNDALPDSLINPFHFSEPLAPLVAARQQRQAVHLRKALEAVGSVAARCDCLLIEGAGGLLAPLGEGFDARDFITRFRCETVVVARNQLGTINHTRLTVEALKAKGVTRIKVVLMGAKLLDLSAKTNARILGEVLAPVMVLPVPYLGPKASRVVSVGRTSKKLKKLLAPLVDSASLSPRSLAGAPRGAAGATSQAKKIVDS